MSVFDYRRRPTSATRVGGVLIGSRFPVRLQSMNNTSTTDIPGSVDQAMRIAAAGADIDRLTAQGVREAEAMGEIRAQLRAKGCDIPLVADIHFNPRAAFAAAERVEKVRINPGNFVDPGRVFKHIDYTPQQYAAELRKIDDTFGAFLDVCRAHGTAVRIGVNHGSLSDRIMSRYGDTPAGMAESAMEFLRVAVSRGFSDIVISIKASNSVVMVHTVRLLVKAMDAENMHFPLHLGVTEAGDGEDGRVRSAVGIGTLLAEGIGDTIRVSLSEEPECEVPVAKELATYIASRAGAPSIEGEHYPGYDSVNPQPRPTMRIGSIGGDAQPYVAGLDEADFPTVELSASLPRHELVDAVKAAPDSAVILSSGHINAPAEIAAAVHSLTAAGCLNPVIARLTYDDLALTDDQIMVRAAADFGSLWLNGLIEGMDLQAPSLSSDRSASLPLGILQATRRRISRTEFVSCPGCGRTLFDLQSTVKAVKEATSHLKGLKIAVMGCIVNGPGEMADADYGYVGAAAGNITIYRGKTAIEKNIPSALAVERLTALIKADGRWVDPA